MKNNGGPRKFGTWVSMKAWLEKPQKKPRRKFMAYRNADTPIRGKYRPQHC